MSLVDLNNRIVKYTTEIANALDRNDYLTALKLRAAQKVLEELSDEKQGYKASDTLKYITAKQAADILGVDVSNITRRASKIQGSFQDKHKWFILKDKIDEIAKQKGRAK